jgi:hypothetical protein
MLFILQINLINWMVMELDSWYCTPLESSPATWACPPVQRGPAPRHIPLFPPLPLTPWHTRRTTHPSGESTPLATRAAPRDPRRALRPTIRPRLASRDLRRALRPATRPAPCVPRPCHPLFPRLPYIILRNRANSCSNRISKHRINLTSIPPFYNYLSPSKTHK